VHRLSFINIHLKCHESIADQITRYCTPAEAHLLMNYIVALILCGFTLTSSLRFSPHIVYTRELMNEYNEEAIMLVLRKVDLGTFRFYLSNT
jgi:hypothetical protein